MLNLLYAKSNPRKTLLEHMIDVGCCAVTFLQSPSSNTILQFLCEMWACGEEEAIAIASYVCALHDIGKDHPWWQRKLQETMEDAVDVWKKSGLSEMLQCRDAQGFRHEYYSAEIMKKLWENECAGKLSRRTIKAYAYVLALHHQKDEGNTDYKLYNKRDDIENKWCQTHQELELLIRERYLCGYYLKEPKHLDATCMCLSALLIVCDWVASSSKFDNLSGEDYYASSLHMAKSAMRDFGLTDEELAYPQVDCFQKMWPEIHTPRPLQAACDRLSDKALLTIIEAPMGEGKTEAALYVASRLCKYFQKRGVYMALPTQATSNQMQDRVQNLMNRFGGASIRLLHGASFLKEELNNDEASQWLRPARRAMLGANAVGTVDQCMASVLRIKFSLLRLLGLQNKVLIIDEIHAYDAYMGKIIEVLLQWCSALRIPVVLLSATLQNSQRECYMRCFGADIRQPIVSYPLITQAYDDGYVTYTTIESGFRSSYHFECVALLGKNKELARRAMQKIDKGGCLCILVNTVKQAQSIYRELQAVCTDDVELTLFHARFPFGKRNAIEHECLRCFGKGNESVRPEKAIVVATQTIEQSLDVDFDCMITEIAPIDLLLQRAGRVHRHRDRKRPEGMHDPLIEVLVPTEESMKETDSKDRYQPSSYVYAPFVLENTHDVLKSRKTIAVPEDVRTVIESAYGTITEQNMLDYLIRDQEQQFMTEEAKARVIMPPDSRSFTMRSSKTSLDLHEIEDGFAPEPRPTTRMAEESVRIAFAGETLFDVIKNGKPTVEECREVFMRSVSLPQRMLAFPIESGEEYVLVEKGVLRGCLVSKSESHCGNLINDDILGILQKEGGQ